MANLTKTQRAAVEHVTGPLLIVAGAGTGKTTVLTEKIAYLIEQGLAKPEEILALTFTDKAADELVARVDERLNSGYLDLAVSTFHAFAERLLRECGTEIGLSRNFKILTETESWLLVRKNIFDLGLDYYRPLGNPGKYIHDLLAHFSKCKDELIAPEKYLELAENTAHDSGDDNVDEKSRLTELANAYYAYNKLVLDAGGLDFGDLMYYSVKLLQDRPRIKERLNKRYKFVLVDEFQDVNWAQYVLVQLISAGGQLTVVGDDDQSIYAFRGASVSNILRFKDDFKNVTNIVLTENFRSRQEILDTAYTVIQNNNPERLESVLQINKKLIAAREWEKMPAGQIPVCYEQVATGDDEVHRLLELLTTQKQSDQTASWDDFAILVRANNHAEPFIRALESARIPYEFLSAAGLYRQPIVLDALALLTAAHQTRDDLSIFRLLHLPIFNLLATDIQALISEARKKSWSYFEALHRAPECQNITETGRGHLAKLHSLIEAACNESKTAKPTALLYSFLESSGYLEYLTKGELAGDRTIIRQIHHLKQFFDQIAAFEDNTTDAHVAHLIEYIRAVQEAGDDGAVNPVEDTPDSVNILTVHSSKGLEFKYVFLVNVVEERFPTRRRGEGIEVPPELIHESVPTGDVHYQEERRLFYVAATRAKERLFILSAQNYGGVRSKKVSRFIVEAGLVAPENNTVRAIIDGVGKNAPKSNEGRDTAPPVYEVPPIFSFSQIKSYETCPYQYKLAHILKLPTKSSASLSFGQSIHLTLQDFYQRVKELNSAAQVSLFDVPAPTENPTSELKVPTLDELLQMYQNHWIPDWYESKQQQTKFFEQGKDILKKFYAAQDGRWTQPVGLEMPFKIKIGNYTVRGRMDRVDQLPDGSLHIIDYKTGQPKEKLTSEDKEQLLIYQIAAEALPEFRHVGPTGKLTFYYLGNGSEASFIGDPADLDKLRGKISDTIDRIYARDFAATPNQFACSHCDFRSICEFRI